MKQLPAPIEIGQCQQSRTKSKAVLNQKARDQSKQARKGIVLSRDNKEIFVKRLVQFFDLSGKHVEARNQIKDTLVDFTVLW